MKRKHYISLLLMLLLCTKATAQDITIAEFKELPHDLTARTTTMIDNAGEAGAVIKFLVRDMNIVIEPNLGVLKREERQGEIDLWVPKGTKRITIKAREDEEYVILLNPEDIEKVKDGDWKSLSAADIEAGILTLTFDGLTPNTTYYIFARKKEMSYSYAGKVLARLVESGALSCESLGHSHIFRVA